MRTLSERPEGDQSHVADVVGRRHRRRNRRVVVTILLGVLGLVLASVWAVSIVTTTPGSSTATGASLIMGAAPTGDTSALANRITNTDADTSLPINFAGRWGNIPADAVDNGTRDPATGGDYELFEVDLSNFATTRLFFLEIGVNNTPDDFRALQFEFVMVDGACADADLDNSSATGYDAETLYVESSDSTIVYSNLAGPGASTSKTLCVGIADTGGAKANDADGTFIRREGTGTTAPDPMPAFFAVLGEHS